MEIKIRLRELIKKEKLSIRLFAEKVELLYTTINNLLNGSSKNPSFKTMVQISVKCDIQLEELYEIDIDKR